MTSPLEQKKLKITGPNVVTANRTGDGAVTSMLPWTIVAFLVTAPTPITFGEIAGEIPVAWSGPALPLANTATVPALTAASPVMRALHLEEIEGGGGRALVLPTDVTEADQAKAQRSVL